jgi:hypothetical protein
MSKALGTDDSVNTCECCGKTNLKFTVAIELDCGEIVHYGSVCAGRNTGETRPQINAEIKTETQRVRDAASSEYRASPELVAYEAKLAERNRNREILPGIASMEYVKLESIAADQARVRIAAKHGLKSYEISA